MTLSSTVGSQQRGKRITAELTRRRESKHPSPRQVSYETRSRRSRPTKLLGCELIMRPIAPPAQDLPYRHKVEDGAFWILEAQIRTEAPKGNSRCAKRGFGGGWIRNAQRHVVRLAHRLVAFGLKQRHLRAVVPNADERHGLRLVLDLQTQDVAKPGDRARQIAIPNANVIDASAVK